MRSLTRFISSNAKRFNVPMASVPKPRFQAVGSPMKRPNHAVRETQSTSWIEALPMWERSSFRSIAKCRSFSDGCMARSSHSASFVNAIGYRDLSVRTMFGSFIQR